MNVLPDDILGAILERIDTQVCLHRAASTCKRWHGIIADAAFRRRFRSLHARAVVAGEYCNYSPLHPSIFTEERRTMGSVFFIPSSSSPIDAGHYSLDFLPDDNSRVEDNRGSLLLMKHSRGKKDIRYLILCEPLTRSYIIIPQPRELVAGSSTSYFRRYYLIDGSGREDAAGSNISMSNFRVVCEHYMGHGLHIMVFDPNDDGSSDTSSTAWKEKDVSSILKAGVSGLRELGRAAGSWYFCDADQSNLLIVLDGRTGEVSTCMLPSSETWKIGGTSGDFCVTEGRDGKPRVCSVVDGTMKVFAMSDYGECELEKTLMLGKVIRVLTCPRGRLNQPMRILTRGPGFVILSLCRFDEWTVTIDLETMKVALGVDYMVPMYPCELPWPQRLRGQ